MRQSPNILQESPKQLDPGLQVAIDQSFRNDPELRKDIYQSIDVPDTEEYIIDAEHGKVKFSADPKKVLKDYITDNNLGDVIDIISGGNGIAALLDDDKVIKITGDEAEHRQAQSLKGKQNEYVANVFATAPFKTPYYTSDSSQAYIIVLELLTHPTTPEEKMFTRCCCREDNPIYVDFYSDPTGKALIHPPVDGSPECRQVYDDIVNIRKEIEATGRRWLDIGISNLGMKNGHYALLDLGTNDPLPPTLKEENIRNQHQLWRHNPKLEVGDKIVVIDRKGFRSHYLSDEELTDVLETQGYVVGGGLEELAANAGYRWDAGQMGWYNRDDDIEWQDVPELLTPYMVVNVSVDENRNTYYTLLTPTEYEDVGKERIKIENWDDITLDTLYELNVDPKSLYPGNYTWVYSKDTTPKRYLKEEYEFHNDGGEITPKIISLIRTAHRLNESLYHFDSFYNTLRKYLDVGGIFSSSDGKQIAATLWLIIKEGGGFSDWNITNLLWEPLPNIYYYTVEFYAEEAESEEILEECLQSGGHFYGELSEEDCECIQWTEFYDDEKDEYRECTEDEKDEGKCDCDQMEDKYVDQYYYEELQAEYLSTVELEYLNTIDELTDTVNANEETVELMSQYYDTTEYQLEGDFDFDEEGMVINWADHDAEVEYHLELLNDALYPDRDTLNDTTSVEVIKEEQQLDLFHGGWPFDSVMEDEDKEWIMKDYPENAVKYLYKKWDQDGVSWEDLKLLGMQGIQGDGVTMLLKRYIMNTQAPIPVTSLWDCDDLARLFDDDNHEELIRKYLCGEDAWDWDGWYDHNEFYEGMLDNLDDGSWKMIMEILGIKDKEVAGRLLEGHVDNDFEDDIAAEKESEIDEIRNKITRAYSIEQEDATKRAIFDDIRDKIEDWFDGTGKWVRDNNNGSYSWIIESDLKRWISDDDWDNTDFFQFHEDYASRPLEDVMRDMARLTPDQLFGEIMIEEFGRGDDYNEGKRGDHLEVDGKYFDGYWYPDISEEYFNDILYDDLYELVPQSKEPSAKDDEGNFGPPKPTDPASLTENIDQQKVNPPLESGDEIIVIDVKDKEGEIPDQVPELFVPYRVTTTPKRDQYWYGINRPMKDVSYPDRPGVLSNKAIMRYLMPDTDTWILVEKNKGMWDDDIDLLGESVTNFKELYNASPRPLQQILMDQWKAKQNPEWHPEGNVLKHIITVTNRAFAEQPENINLILSAYFHDLGKLATLGVNPKTGQPTAHGHEKVSTQLVNEYSEFIESLGGDPEEIGYMVSNHMKMKPRVWDVMRQSKKDKITDHPSFGNLDALSKIDRGGLQLDEEKMEFGKDKGFYDDDQYYDFTPFTNMEVKLLNKLAQEFTSEDLEMIGESDAANLPRALEERYNDIMKLFSIPARTMEDWVIASKYARWAVDNWGEAAGEVDEKRDYAQVKTPVKIYPSYFEVEAEESGWEKIFKHGSVDIPGFSSQDVTDRATADWYDWGGEMETYDYGDWESDGWEIESTTHRETIKEQSENLPLKKFLHQNYTQEVFRIYKKLALAAKLLLTSYEDSYTEGGVRNFKYGGFGGGEGGRGEIGLLADKIETAQMELYDLWGTINEDLYKLGLIDTTNIGPPDERDFISYNRLRGLTPNPVVKAWARQIIERIDNMELVALTGEWEGNDKGVGKEVEIWGGDTPYILREQKETQLSPELEVGDSIRVIDIDRERERMKGRGEAERPEILTPYIVVEKESAGHKAQWPWRYTLLPADKHQDYLNGDYMVGRGTAKLLYPWIYQWIKVHKKPITEQKEKLNPSLNIGDVIRVVDVDKDTRYKQSAGSGMYRTRSRGELHGEDTFPTIMETYYVTSPEPVNTEQITFGNEPTFRNLYWNMLPITGENIEWDRGNRILTTNDKWIMVKKHVSNIPQEIEARQKEIDASGKNITSRRLNEQDAESGLEDDDLYVEYGPFTALEVKILNTIVREFTFDELKAIATRTFKTDIQRQVTSRYEDVMKLFGEPNSGEGSAQIWTIISKYARWALENRHEADDGDYGQIKNARKEYPSEYEVEAEESGWEQVFKRGSANVTAFGATDAEEKSREDFYGWGGEMHTYEHGDYESDDWEITDAYHFNTLKEQKIDTTKIPKEEISPPLKVGDKIFIWDLEMDPAPPGTTTLTIPNTTVGIVVHVYEGNASEEPRGDMFRGGIKYEIDTYDGHLGLYQGVEDYDYYADDGGGRDKWIIIRNTPLTEAIIPQLPEEERPNIPNYIRRLLIIGRFEYKGGWGKNSQTFLLYMTPTGKIVDIAKSGNLSNIPFQIGDTINIFDLRDFEKKSDYTLTMGGKLRGDMTEEVNRHLQAAQKDFLIKRRFFESFDKMDLTAFIKVRSQHVTTAQLVEKRKLIFDFLSEVKNKEMTNENFYSHFLIGGKDWIDTYSTVLKKDSGLLSEDGDKIKNLIWDTTIHSLKNKNKEVTLREAKRNIIPTANRLINLWKETL